MGGEKADGRWHTAARGKRIVYLSEHPAVALIEVLANLKGNPELFPDRYRLMKINVADDVSTEVLDSVTLEPRTIGDRWLVEKRTALLAVPSFPSPESLNYLLNPLHPDARKLAIDWCKWLQYDKRLFHVTERA